MCVCVCVCVYDVRKVPARPPRTLFAFTRRTILFHDMAAGPVGVLVPILITDIGTVTRRLGEARHDVEALGGELQAVLEFPVLRLDLFGVRGVVFQQRQPPLLGAPWNFALRVGAHGARRRCGADPVGPTRGRDVARFIDTVASAIDVDAQLVETFLCVEAHAVVALTHGLDLVDGRTQLTRFGVACRPARRTLALADEEGGGETVPSTKRVVTALRRGRGRRHDGHR